MLLLALLGTLGTPPLLRWRRRPPSSDRPAAAAGLGT